MEFKIAQNWQEDHPARQVRTKVFIEEQGFNNEFDDIDDISYHALILEGDEAIACARMFKKEGTDDTYILGRIAVLKEYRKQHLGAQILQIMETKIIELGGRMAELSAQMSAVGFYEKCGYHQQGKSYYDEYCPHIKMFKYL